jgi:hypothetical protein
MTKELYLVAHKVRGEPAFDVAVQMECPECNGNCADGRDPNGYTCTECDSLGYWWIIPTSGHRAYPYWHKTLAHVSREATFCYCESGEDPFVMIDPMPAYLPDHYTLTASPGEVAFRLNELLALVKPATPTFGKIPRR